VIRWHLVGDARIADLALGANQPLRQSGFRQKEGASNLGGRKAAKGAQGQSDLRLAIERGVTTGENQPQPVVRKCGWRRHRVLIDGDRDFLLQKFVLFVPRALAPGHIDQLAMSGGHDPRGRVLRDPTVGPMPQRRRQGVLHRLLGAVERAAQPDQAGDDPAMLVAKHRLRASADIGRV